jgi:hypothetical protein
MPKRERESETYCNSNQRLPKGHFDSDGRSEGKSTGAVRPTPDAYQGPRSEGETNTAKPEN